MKEVQAAVDAGEISDPPAQLWTQPDGTLRVMMIHGDDHAVLNLDYCFRTDGTLAASVSTHGAVQGIHPDPNIEVGPVARTTRREFDRCGRQVAQQVGPWVGSGGKPAPEGTGVIDREEPPVPHIRSLLFFELIDGSSLPHAALETPRC